jgi:hypothetical protein
MAGRDFSNMAILACAIIALSLEEGITNGGCRACNIVLIVVFAATREQACAVLLAIPAVARVEVSSPKRVGGIFRFRKLFGSSAGNLTRI